MLIHSLCSDAIVKLASGKAAPLTTFGIPALLAALKTTTAMPEFQITVDKGRKKGLVIEYYPIQVCNAGTNCLPCDKDAPKIEVLQPIRKEVTIGDYICTPHIFFSNTTVENWCSSGTGANFDAVLPEIAEQFRANIVQALQAAHIQLNRSLAAQFKAAAGLHPDGSASKIVQPFNTSTGVPNPNWASIIRETYAKAGLSYGDMATLTGTYMDTAIMNAAGGGINAAGVNMRDTFFGIDLNNFQYEQSFEDGQMLTFDPKGFMFLTYSDVRKNIATTAKVGTIDQVLGNILPESDPFKTAQEGTQHYTFVVPDPYLAAAGFPLWWDCHLVVTKSCGIFTVEMWLSLSFELIRLPYDTCNNTPVALLWKVCQPEPIACNTTPAPTTPPTPLCVVPITPFDCTNIHIPKGTFVSLTLGSAPSIVAQTPSDTMLTSMKDLWMLLTVLGVPLQYNAVTNTIYFIGNAATGMGTPGDTINISFSGDCPIDFNAELQDCPTTLIAKATVGGGANQNNTVSAGSEEAAKIDAAPTAKQGKK